MQWRFWRRKNRTTSEQTVQAQHDLVRQPQKKSEPRVQIRPSRVQDDVEYLAKRFYEKLKGEIYSHCGLPDKYVITFYDELLGDSCLTRKEGYGQELIQKLCEFCGLTLRKCGSDYTVYLDDTSTFTQLCTLVSEEGAVQLDFPALIAENERRRQLWKLSLPDIAENMLDVVRNCITAMPDKHCGIPDKLVFLWSDYGFKNDYYKRRQRYNAALGDSFDFGGDKIKYCNLLPEQLMQLLAEMNRRLAHGEVDLECILAPQYPQLTIIRVEGKTVDDPYLDYKGLYAPYDRVTPELNKTFETIIDGLRFPDTTEQMSQMLPRRELMYFPNSEDDLSFWALKEYLGEVHLQHFIEALEKRYPFVNVLGVQFLSYICCSESHNERVVVSVKFNNHAAAQSSLFVDQIHLEDQIDSVRSHEVTMVASRLIDMIKEQMNKHPECKDGAKWRHVYREDRWVVELPRAKYGEMKIDLRKARNQVENRKFIRQIEESVWQQTRGVINLDIDTCSYQISIDK